MRFITVSKQRWKQAFGASLTIALLAAVAVGGSSLFGSEVLGAWKTPDSAEQALASSGVFNFDAPEAMVAQFEAKAEEPARGKTSNDALVAKNWKFTEAILSPFISPYLAANTSVDYQLVTNPNYTVFGLNFSQLNGPLYSPYASAVAISGAVSFYGNWLSQVYLPFVNAILPPSPLRNSIDSLLVSTVDSLIAFQTGINSYIPPIYHPAPIKPASPSS